MDSTTKNNRVRALLQARYNRRFKLTDKLNAILENPSKKIACVDLRFFYHNAAETAIFDNIRLLSFAGLTAMEDFKKSWPDKPAWETLRIIMHDEEESEKLARLLIDEFSKKASAKQLRNMTEAFILVLEK